MADSKDGSSTAKSQKKSFGDSLLGDPKEM